MRVTCVGIKPTAEQKIALTPELVAAVGARYSRNNEGLEEILAKVDGMDQNAAVDSIFRMVDYGHASIADMAPVVMFLDDISVWMALRIWELCPTAGGQESSTRYVKMSPENVYHPENAVTGFEEYIKNAFVAYDKSYDIWDHIATVSPSIIGIPEELANSTDKKDLQKVARMRRNYAFDRARYYLPMCCKTNMMMSMSARGWVDLVKQLASDSRVESVDLANKMREQLGKVVPSLVKHATADESYIQGYAQELTAAADAVVDLDVPSNAYARPFVDIMYAPDSLQSDIVKDLNFHTNRYSYFGPSVKRTVVRFGWNALTIAELRDLNRHRTGTKTFNLIPTGIYLAEDQIDLIDDAFPVEAKRLRVLRHAGNDLVRLAVSRLRQGDASFVYYLPLGAQCQYEHVTTADKFLYQCELRTGLGAHYSYAARMREILELWHQKFPSTRNMIVAGTAEPE